MLGVGGERGAGLVQRFADADRGEHFLQAAAVGGVVEDLGGGDDGDPRAVGLAAHPGFAGEVVGAQVAGDQRVEPIAERLAQVEEERRVGRVHRRVRAPQREQAVGVFGDLAARHRARALRAPQPPLAQELAEVAVAGAVLREEQHARAFFPFVFPQRHLRADDQLHAQLLRPHVRARHAVHAVAVGERQRGEPEFVRALDQLLGMARPLQEGEVALGPEGDVGVHERRERERAKKADGCPWSNGVGSSDYRHHPGVASAFGRNAQKGTQGS